VTAEGWAAVPPARIETARLVLRCWDPRDAPLLKDAVDASLDHLRPWMPWVQGEPTSLGEKVELLRRFRGLFDVGQDFPYGVFEADERRVLGGTGLHTRVGEDAFEIGYWIHAGHVGQGLATEVVAALTKVAFTVSGVDRVEIHVDPANEVSCRIPRRLGYVEEGRLRRRLPAFGPGQARRDMVVFSLLAEELPRTPSAGAELAAYDVLGERVL
jgi:RimJ/RimL family protein N-acetyltransferase